MDNFEEPVKPRNESPLPAGKLPPAPLFIIGYMACGKTTFGRALARATGRDFIDLDFYIEQRFRMSVSRIFAEKGEEDFRRMESAMLREAGEFENVVIACGGGTPCFNDNIEYMNSRGLTVWLEASVEKMVRRLVINNSRRPLMAGRSEAEIREGVVKGLAAREPYYSQAAMRLSGEDLEDRRQIGLAVTKFLKSVL